MKRLNLVFLAFICSLTFITTESIAQTNASLLSAANTKTNKTIELKKKKNLKGWYTYIKGRGRSSDPQKVFTVSDGMIRVSGEEWGCITTNKEYENYTLTVEFKWGTKTWEPRVKNARDNGILVHSTGKDGGYDDTWMHGIECQIIEGGTGDLLVVGDKTEKFAITCPVATEKQGGSYLFQPDGKPVTIHGGRINWYGRDANWEDVIDFRGKSDVEKPVGEWNKMEVIAKGDNIAIYLNGVLVNQAMQVKPSKGRIQIQSEGAEMFVRRVDIAPIITTDFARQIRIGAFNANVTPPIGSPVAYAPARSIMDSLSARGIVILSDEKPIVLCAVDWIGIANEGLEVWRQRLAAAANTSIDRVSVHALHQHDGIHCDFTMARIMDEYGMGGIRFDTAFLYAAIQHVADAVSIAAKNTQPVTHLGFGQAKVDKVASNRRILDEDGKVKIIRWSATTDSASKAAPEGLIDPWLKCVSFWNNENPLALMTYYTTHPQSYYGDGDVTCEFIGIARNAREKAMDGIPHIHFNGASGNIAAGKYNDGSKAMRPVLANRVEAAMAEAWQQTKKTAISEKDMNWKNTEVTLPLGKNIVEAELRATLSNEKAAPFIKVAAAEKLAWYQRSVADQKVNISALRLGRVWLLNLPGELFVEYQLAAQKMKPEGQVCTAAYEEYGPGYIGTKISYSQGGYETSDIVSGTAPEVEKVLMKAIKKVLK